nr:hypothetical protein L204_01087 [Cryptococcus depauperatus CBS 7855]
MPSLREKLKQAEADLAAAKQRGSSSIKSYEERVKKLKEELKKPQPHPACGVSRMSFFIPALSALVSGLCARTSSPLDSCYVAYTSVIYYGYNRELAKLPKPDDPDSAKARFAKLIASRKPRQDLWANMKAHPSAFLTTKFAQPQLFPFPLGKTRPDAAIKDELWWEGGNAPHVGHFNRPQLPAPPIPDEEVLMKRVQASMKREAQEALWKRRIRDIQILSVIVIISFLSKKAAAIALAILIYRTVSSEINDMLKPPANMDEIWKYIDRIGYKNEKNPKPTQLTGGMTYVFEQDGDWVKKLADVPIDVVAPPVLMTTTNHYYAGPGNEMKVDD